ncbi:MAG: DNA polymerase III subunit epsilon [Pseudomonadota bacterium]
MLEVILDTETTGLSADDGDRVIEIGCLKFENHVLKDTYHTYINPERAISSGATAVHNLTEKKLKGEPVFAEIADDFLRFIEGASLVIHNAPFDLSMLNAELVRLSRPTLTNPVIDTLVLARRKFPGAPASLDALCDRFGISRQSREEGHGALVDVHLLHHVYIQLIGGAQNHLNLSVDEPQVADTLPTRRERPIRLIQPNEKEQAAHRALLDTMDDPLWDRLKKPA